MKRLEKTGLTVLFMLLLQIMVLGLLAPVSVKADTPDGLINQGGTYYFYRNGAMVKNSWESVVVDGKTSRMYFGKNGAAYRAGSLYENAYNVKIFKIKKKKYGFDMNSCLVEPGVYVDGAFRLQVFGKNGKYNLAKTNKIRKKLKVGKISKKMYRTVVRALGNPVSVSRSDSCSPWNEKDSFTDVLLTYPHFEVQLIQNDRTGQYMLDGYFPR